MNRKIVKILFSGTLASTCLFQSFGSSGCVIFVDDDQANESSQIIHVKK